MLSAIPRCLAELRSSLLAPPRAFFFAVMGLLSLALLFPSSSQAQFTQVSGTVTDPNGLPYSNGTVSVRLVPSSASPTLNGLPYQPPQGPGQLDANGSFVMNLADNAVLLPAGTQWQFTVCGVPVPPPVGFGSARCFTSGAITITGASQSISAELTAAALAQIRVAFGPFLPATDFGVKGMARKFADITLTSGSATLQTATAISFTVADVGKKISCATFGTVENAVFDVVSITDPTHLVMSGTSGFTSTANATCVIGPDDTVALRAGAAAAFAQHKSLILPGGGVLIGSAVGIFDAANKPFNLSIVGQGVNNTVIYPRSDFNWASCLVGGNTCLGAAINGGYNHHADFSVDGYGHNWKNYGTVPSVILVGLGNGELERVKILNFVQPNAGGPLHCFYGSGSPVKVYSLEVANCHWGATFEGSYIKVYGSTFQNAPGPGTDGWNLRVLNATQFLMAGGLIDEGLPNIATRVVNSKDVTFEVIRQIAGTNGTMISVDGTSTVNIYGSEIDADGASGIGLSVASGAVVRLRDTRFVASNGANPIANSGTVLDLEGNTIPSFTGNPIRGPAFATGEPLTDIRAALTGSPGSAGAVCDGSTDDVTAIKNSIATIGARTSARGTSGGLFIPDNVTCVVASPIISHVANLHLYGVSKTGSVISASGVTGFRGPLFVQTPPAGLYAVLPTGAALLTGSGSSYLGDGTASYWLDLRMCLDCAELNGRTAFTAETTFNVTSLASRNGFLFSSGRGDSIDGYLQSFALWTETDSTLVGQLRTSTGFSSIAGGAITTGANHHAALSWDGTTLRLFLDGTQVASTARSGTLSQKPYEAVRIGPDQDQFPDGGIGIANNPNGRMDGVRLSNNARYTSNFTPPTAKWGAPDANTLVQCNFDNQPDIFTVCRQKDNIPVYLPVMRDHANFTGGLRLAHLTLDTNGIAEGPYLTGANDFVFEDVRLRAVHSGLLFEFNSYNGVIKGLQCELTTNTGRYCAAGNRGISNFENLQSTGNPFYHFFFSQPSGNYGPIFISPSAGTPTGGRPLVFRGGGTNSSINVHDYILDSENGAAMDAMLVLDGIDTANVYGGSGDATVSGTDSCYKVVGGGTANFFNVNCNITASIPTQVFDILGTPTGSVNVIGLKTSATPNNLVNSAGLPYFNQLDRLRQTVVTFSATPTFNALVSNNFKITLTGNVTSSTLSNAQTGQVLTWQICQDATGSRTFVWPTNVKGATTIGGTLSTCSAQSFKYDGTNAYALAAGVINQ